MKLFFIMVGLSLCMHAYVSVLTCHVSCAEAESIMTCPHRLKAPNPEFTNHHRFCLSWLDGREANKHWPQYVHLNMIANFRGDFIRMNQLSLFYILINRVLKVEIWWKQARSNPSLTSSQLIQTLMTVLC